MTTEQLYTYDDLYLMDAAFDTVAAASAQECSDYLPSECEALDDA